jgi:hypothetical protein
MCINRYLKRWKNEIFFLFFYVKYRPLKGVTFKANEKLIVKANGSTKVKKGSLIDLMKEGRDYFTI